MNLIGIMTFYADGELPDEARTRRSLQGALALSGLEVEHRAQDNIRSQMNVQRTDPESFFGAVQTEVDPDDSGDVMQAITGSAHAGAKAQEFGAEIYAKDAQALHFITGGREFFLQNVTLPPRPYLEPALEDSRSYTEDAIATAMSLAGWERA